MHKLMKCASGPTNAAFVEINLTPWTMSKNMLYNTIHYKVRISKLKMNSSVKYALDALKLKKYW